MQRCIGHTDLGHQIGAALVPLFQIGHRSLVLGRTGEDQISHGQIADRTRQRRSRFPDLIAKTQRGLAHFVRGTGITDHGRIHFVPVDDDRIVTDLGHVGTFAPQHEPGQHNGRVGFADQKTRTFQIGYLAFGRRDAVGQLLPPHLLRLGLGQFRLRLGNALLERFDERIRTVRRLRPTVTGLRLEELPRAIHLDIPVAIGAIDVHVHVSLHKKGTPSGLGMLELQNGVAIVKIMTRKDLLDFFQTPLQPIELQVINFPVIRRNPRGFQQERQRPQ